MTSDDRYRAALRFRFLTPYYDRLVEYTMNDRAFKEELTERVSARPGDRILDFGCGTGTLACMLKRRYPEAEVYGLDVDPDVLGQAREKGDRAGLEVHWLKGSIKDHGARMAPVNQIVSSLVFHHLTDDEKRQTLLDMRGILAPGGELHLCDFTRPNSLTQSLLFTSVRLLDGWGRTACHVQGKLADLVLASGFTRARTESPRRTWAGTIAFTRATNST